MENSEIKRCNRCQKWVYDGSPMCPSCTQRHNEVYNHFRPKKEDNVKESNYSIQSTLIKYFLGFVLGFALIYSILNLRLLDINSFPENYSVYEVDNDLYRNRSLCNVQIFTDKNFGYFISIVDVETSKNVLSFFMHPNSEVKFALPVGSFRIVYDAGKKWDNDLLYFDSKRDYTISDFIYIFEENKTYSFRLEGKEEIRYQDTQ